MQRFVLGVIWTLFASTALAQDPAAPADSAAKQGMPAVSAMRASWLSDRVPLRVGEMVTVILDEQTSASERVSQIATARRSQNANFSLSADGDAVVGASALDTGMDNDSRDVGEAGRKGDLSGIVTARVLALDGNGVAEIEGSKKVTIDGRDQTITLHGFVRSADVSASNIVYSSRIADAEITYTGKKISPRRGIIGRILSILWP